MSFDFMNGTTDIVRHKVAAMATVPLPKSLQPIVAVLEGRISSVETTQFLFHLLHFKEPEGCGVDVLKSEKLEAWNTSDIACCHVRNFHLIICDIIVVSWRVVCIVVVSRRVVHLEVGFGLRCCDKGTIRFVSKLGSAYQC